MHAFFKIFLFYILLTGRGWGEVGWGEVGWGEVFWGEVGWGWRGSGWQKVWEACGNLTSSAPLHDKEWVNVLLDVFLYAYMLTDVSIFFI